MPNMPAPTTIKPTPEQELAMRELAEEAAFIHERIRACHSRTRIELLALLLGGPMDVTRIAARAGLDIPVVSRNLTILRHEGLVVCALDKTRHVHTLSRAVRIEKAKGELVLRQPLACAN